MQKSMAVVCAVAGIAVAAIVVACSSGGSTCTGAGCGALGEEPHGSGTGTKPPGSSGTTSGDHPLPPPAPPTACSNGLKTTLTGKVYDPAGANALYDVV